VCVKARARWGVGSGGGAAAAGEQRAHEANFAERILLRAFRLGHLQRRLAINVARGYGAERDDAVHFRGADRAPNEVELA
jgi:hypothetical protein